MCHSAYDCICTCDCMHGVCNNIVQCHVCVCVSIAGLFVISILPIPRMEGLQLTNKIIHHVVETLTAHTHTHTHTHIHTHRHTIIHSYYST